MRRIGRVAVGVSALGILTALLLAVLAVPLTDNDSQLWVQVVVLAVPSAGGIWLFARTAGPPPPPWVFVWIVTLIIGSATAIGSALQSWGSPNPERGYATTAIAALIAVQGGVCLWATDARRRSQSSK